MAGGYIDIPIAVHIPDTDTFIHRLGGDSRLGPVPRLWILRNPEIEDALPAGQNNLRLVAGDDLSQYITLTVDVPGFGQCADLRHLPGITQLVAGFEPIYVRQRFGNHVGKRIPIHVHDEHSVDINVEHNTMPCSRHVTTWIAIDIPPGHDILVAVPGHVRHRQTEIPQPGRLIPIAPPAAIVVDLDIRPAIQG